jgi:filamentous hemagglutinin family protein
MKKFSKIALSCSTILASTLLTTAAFAQTLPSGGSVVAGTATIDVPTINSQTITTSGRAVINWNSFNVGAGNIVIFNQPNNDAATLNRVTGTTGSTIAGSIHATNGSVYLINPNGIQITDSGTVNVGRGFVASSLNMADADFMAGTNLFSGTGGLVQTTGDIMARAGGFIGLLGGEVQAGGVISAPAGTVMIGTSTTTTLDLNGGNFLQVSLPSSAVLAGNGSVAALSADAARTAVRHMVNLPAAVESTALSGTNGKITLSGTINAGGGSVNVAASSDVALAGATISVRSNTVTGGSTVTLRAGALGSGVGTVTRSGTNQIATNASGAIDIYYNPASYAAPVNYSGLIASGSGPLKTWMLVNNVTQLQALNTNLGGTYALSRDIDASATASWNNGEGFVPIGSNASAFLSNANAFNGTFDGQGHVISGLTINRPTTDYVGLFGYIGTGSILRNVGLSGGSVSARARVGGLVGWNNGGTISQSYATGAVSGTLVDAGGLVGFNYGGTISQSYATGAVSGGNSVGGLVGYTISGTISQSYATGAVSGTDYVGGLVGWNNGTTISQAYATGKVSGTGINVGGLAGTNSGTVSNSYWDSYSTGRANGFGSGSGTNVTAVTSDPTQSGATNYAYNAAAYGNFTASNWIFINGQTRPFGAWEKPVLAGGVATISNSHQLQLVNQNLGGTYVLSNNIDLSETGRVVAGTPGSYAGMWSSAGFAPIGTFTGTFDGQGHVISGLVINRPSSDFVGLFGFTGSGSILRNIGLSGGSVRGNSYVGGLVGLNYGTISHVYATSAVDGIESVGGLVGRNDFGTITKSYATGAVSGNRYVGGLVGLNNATISQAYATGAVSGSVDVGGLVGLNNATISQAYATGAVSGSVDVGGLVGFNNVGTVSNSYWDSYSTGQANGVGSGSGTNVTAVTSDPNQSGAANYADKASAWSNFQTAGGASDVDAVGGQALTWRIYEGHTTPLLKAFLTPVTSATPGRTVTYDGTAYSISYTLPSGLNASLISGTLSPSSITGTNAGTYRLAAPGIWSSQQGYDFAPVSLTINRAALTVTGMTASNRAYDGTLAATLSGGTLSGLVGAETLNFSGQTGAFGDKNVGTGKAVTVTGLTLANGTNGGLASNYSVTQPTGLTANITTKALTVTADAKTRIYGDANPALTYVSSGLVAGDTLSGALATTAGAMSNVGTYGITQGTLAASSNYALTYTGADLSVTARPITVTADALIRIYGDANPALIYVATGLVNNDTLSGALATTAGATSNVGSYGITQGTLANSNYAITYTGANLSVTARPILVTADAKTRIYGDANPALTYVITSGNLVNSDTLSGALATTAGATSNVGRYHITQGTLAASSNYAITYTGANLSVTARPITVTADAKSRIYGDANPALTYAITSGNLVNNDTLSGALTTTAGATSNVGTYAITRGTLGASANYALTYVGTNLTVTPRALTVTADNQTRMMGLTNPALTYAITSGNLVGGDGLTGSLATAANTASVIGDYAISRGSLSTSTNYQLTFVEGKLAVTPMPSGSVWKVVTENSGSAVTANGDTSSDGGNAGNTSTGASNVDNANSATLNPLSLTTDYTGNSGTCATDPNGGGTICKGGTN